MSTDAFVNLFHSLFGPTELQVNIKFNTSVSFPGKEIESYLFLLYMVIETNYKQIRVQNIFYLHANMHKTLWISYKTMFQQSLKS